MITSFGVVAQVSFAREIANEMLDAARKVSRAFGDTLFFRGEGVPCRDDTLYGSTGACFRVTQRRQFMRCDRLVSRGFGLCRRARRDVAGGRLERTLGVGHRLRTVAVRESARPVLRADGCRR